MCKNEKFSEVDLYEPVQNYFTEKGYTVHGEVNHCDVVAIKNDTLIIIELKLTLNIELLIQATKRQRLTEDVYIAIPKSVSRPRSRKWRDTCHLLRRLEIGWMTVSEDGQVTIVHEPGPFDRARSMRQSVRRRERIFKEVAGRRVSTNIGGSHQTKIRTAYKEKCIHIACCLDRFGPLSAKSLREMGTSDKTYSILYHNYDDWFKRIDRGIYALTETGLKEYKQDQEIASFYIEALKNKFPENEQVDP